MRKRASVCVFFHCCSLVQCTTICARSCASNIASSVVCACRRVRACAQDSADLPDARRVAERARATRMHTRPRCWSAQVYATMQGARGGGGGRACVCIKHAAQCALSKSIACVCVCVCVCSSGTRAARARWGSTLPLYIIYAGPDCCLVVGDLFRDSVRQYQLFNGESLVNTAHILDNHVFYTNLYKSYDFF
jgi:hypothetical protein